MQSTHLVLSVYLFVLVSVLQGAYPHNECSQTANIMIDVQNGSMLESNCTNPPEGNILLQNGTINQTAGMLPTSNQTGEENSRLPSLSQILGQYWTYRAGRRLWRIYPLVFFAVGMVGNSLAFVVFIQKRMRRYSSYIYLAILAAFDQLALLGLFLTMIGQEYAPSQLSHAYCTITMYIQSFANHVSSWLVVMVTIERFIATAAPFKASRLCTVRRALVMSIVIIVVAALINITVFWTSTYTDSHGYPRCIANPDYLHFFNIWQWVDISLFSFIPCILLFVFNIAIVVLMNLAWKRQRLLTNCQARVGAGVFSKQITIMLLLVSFVFLVCTVPASSLFIWRHIEKPEQGLRNGQIEQYAFFVLLNQILGLIFVNNHCFNIVLYALSGNRFRSEMVNVFCCRQRDRDSGPLSKSTHTYTQKKRSTTSSGSSTYEMKDNNSRRHQKSRDGMNNNGYQHDEDHLTCGEPTMATLTKSKKYEI